MAKRGGFPGGMPGNMNNLSETGAEMHADGRGTERIRRKEIIAQQVVELLKLLFPVRERLQK